MRFLACVALMLFAGEVALAQKSSDKKSASSPLDVRDLIAAESNPSRWIQGRIAAAELLLNAAKSGKIEKKQEKAEVWLRDGKRIVATFDSLPTKKAALSRIQAFADRLEADGKDISAGNLIAAGTLNEPRADDAEFVVATSATLQKILSDNSGLFVWTFTPFKVDGVNLKQASEGSSVNFSRGGEAILKRQKEGFRTEIFDRKAGAFRSVVVPHFVVLTSEERGKLLETKKIIGLDDDSYGTLTIIPR
jgi:hypothetical protein